MLLFLTGLLLGLIIGIASICLLLMFLLANARPHNETRQEWETWRVERPSRAQRR